MTPPMVRSSRCKPPLRPTARQERQIRSLYRPRHMIGLELGLSVACAALRKEPTGTPVSIRMSPPSPSGRSRGARSSTAKAAFWSGASRTAAALSLAQGYLALALANGIKLNRDVAQVEPLRSSDVTIEATDPASGCAVRWQEPAAGRRSERALCASTSVQRVTHSARSGFGPQPRPISVPSEWRNGKSGPRSAARHVYLSYRTKAAGWRPTRIKSRRASSTIGGGPAMKLTVSS